MALYPVRCCCEPTKLYGYLELPAGLQSGSATTVLERVSFKLPAFLDIDPDAKPELVASASRHGIQLMRVVNRATGLDEVAVYSDDRPIEFWRTIVGFQELEPADFTFHTIDLAVIAECEDKLGSSREVTVFVEGADRDVSGKVKAVKHDRHHGWTDVTIEELVAKSW